MGRHSLTNLLLAMSHRGLVRAEVRPDPNDRSGGSNVFYSRAPARMAPPAAKPSSSKRVAKDVPPGSRREALLVQAIEQSCQPGEERQGGDLGKALAALDRWVEGAQPASLVLHAWHSIERKHVCMCLPMLDLRRPLAALPSMQLPRQAALAPIHLPAKLPTHGCSAPPIPAATGRSAWVATASQTCCW